MGADFYENYFRHIAIKNIKKRVNAYIKKIDSIDT
jgi:hypothetical protein